MPGLALVDAEGAERPRSTESNRARGKGAREAGWEEVRSADARIAPLQIALEQREQLCLLLESLVESLSDGLVVLDFAGHVVHGSESLLSRGKSRVARGHVPSPDAGQGDADQGFEPSLGPGDQLPRAIVGRLREEARVLAPGQTRTFDLEWDRPELGARIYRVIATAEASPVSGAVLPRAKTGKTGAVEPEAASVLTVFAFHDRTREAAIEEELAQARNLAALGQMAGTVAHELRNPLGGIKGFATLLERDLAGQTGPLHQVDCILRGVESADRIVGDLLEYCRPLHPHLDPIRLDELLEESLAHLKHSPRKADGIECDLLLDPGLPPCLGDRRLLLQVLANLYHNAIAAMEGSGTLSLRVRAAGPVQRPDRLRIVIRDTGCGMTAEEVARIFAPFYSNRAGGTGLGLALVRKVVEAHRGHVHVVSAPGRGTSVVLDLPAAGMERMPELPDGWEAAA